MTRGDDELQRRIESFIAKRAGAPARVSGLRRLTGGASRETWALDATVARDSGNEVLPLIMQRDARGKAPGMSRSLEFALLRAAHGAGVLAPEPLWLSDGEIGEGQALFVRRIEGETLPRRLLRDDAYAPARAALPEQLAEIAARIHAVDYRAAEGLAELPEPPPGVSPAVHELSRFEQVLRMIAPEPHPVFDLALRWLTQAPPYRDARAGDERVLVHGDFRMGNVLFGPEGARAILDWELAHVGDPMEDLAWLCVRSWRFGGAKPVGGIGERDAFYAAYERASGRRVDPERVRWWEVFGNVRWGIICISQARAYLDGHSDSVELASIGRRTAETEWELLELIGS